VLRIYPLSLTDVGYYKALFSKWCAIELEECIEIAKFYFDEFERYGLISGDIKRYIVEDNKDVP
jgi:hypothetical protein